MSNGNIAVSPEQVRGLLEFLKTTVGELESLVATAEQQIRGSEGYWQSGTRATLEGHFSQWKATTQTLLDQMRNESVPEVENWLRNFEEVAHRGLSAG